MPNFKGKQRVQEERTGDMHYTQLPLGADTVYSVYIHHKRDMELENLIGWEKRESTKDKDEAIKNARALYKSYNCDKVEVKKTYRDTKANKICDKTIKVYGDDKIEDIAKPIQIALVILCLVVSLTLGTWVWGS